MYSAKPQSQPNPESSEALRGGSQCDKGFWGIHWPWFFRLASSTGRSLSEKILILGLCWSGRYFIHIRLLISDSRKRLGKLQAHEQTRSADGLFLFLWLSVLLSNHHRGQKATLGHSLEKFSSIRSRFLVCQDEQAKLSHHHSSDYGGYSATSFANVEMGKSL